MGITVSLQGHIKAGAEEAAALGSSNKIIPTDKTKY